MLYLGITLLVFGLFQSLFEIVKENQPNLKNQLQKALSLLYILGFIGGTIVAFTQDQDSEKLNGQIKKIFSSVSRIDSSSIEQVRSLSKSLENTKELVSITDSMNKSVGELLLIRDSLILQTGKINDRLKNQIEFDLMSLRERDAVIEMRDYDMKWTGNDSTSQALEVCIKNMGKRNAILKGGSGYLVFFDKEKRPIFYANIPGSNNETVLVPIGGQENGLCYFSWGMRDLKQLKSISDFAVICMRIKYEDALHKEEKLKVFYSGWSARGDEFGGLKDWQYDLAKKWEVESN